MKRFLRVALIKKLNRGLNFVRKSVVWEKYHEQQQQLYFVNGLPTIPYLFTATITIHTGI